MILYLDTSSLLKVYVNEVYSDLVREWFKEAEAIAISRVGYAEARGEPVLFSSFDTRLLGAARAERLDTLHLSSRDGLVMEQAVEYG